MALKDLLVYLDGSDTAQVRLDVAARLAQSRSAHLTGLHVTEFMPPPLLPVETVGYLNTAQVEDMSEQWREQQSAAAQRAEDKFWDRLRAGGIEGEFRIASGPVARTVALHARYADLVIVGQTDPDEPAPSARNGIVEEALFSSGRPVLVIPYSGQFDSLGRRVLVGWNATREAARAVNDAIPLIEGAELVTVLAVNPRRGIAGTGDVPSVDIAQHLAHHGIKVTASHTVAEEIGIGDVLLNSASDLGADLIVVGGYGHSRVRELILGGVTRTLLQTMTVPVLLSH
jgi:nucleotide-binding universal stress UspA family protein